MESFKLHSYIYMNQAPFIYLYAHGKIGSFPPQSASLYTSLHLNSICHFNAHSPSSKISFWSFSQSLLVLTALNNLAPSGLISHPWRLVIYKQVTKRSSQRFEDPRFFILHLERWAFIPVLCFLCFSQIQISKRICSHSPWRLSLLRNLWWGTLSTAFWKSKYTVSTGSLLYICLLTLSTSS